MTLWFTQNIEPAFSRMEVSDASGARVDQGKLESNTRSQTRFSDELSTDTPILRLQALRTSRRTLLMLAPKRRSVISASALHTNSLEEVSQLTQEAPL